jgi:DNA polymerase III subunit epsilon
MNTGDGTMSQWIAIDVETTGLSRTHCHIVELGAVKFDDTGKIIDRYWSLCKPPVPIPQQATDIHGITDSMVVDAPPFYEAVKPFINFIGHPHRNGAGFPILAHNASFDASVLTNHFERYFKQHTLYYKVACTMVLSRKKNKFLPSHALSKLAVSLNLPPLDPALDAHNAIADCILVKDLWIKIDGPAENYDLVSKFVIGRP